MTGLVGWWPLHRTSGNAVDLSGGGNHGTINGPVRGVAGRGGLQAYSFDGADDYITVPNSSDYSILASGETGTVSMFMYVDGSNVTTHNHALSVNNEWGVHPEDTGGDGGSVAARFDTYGSNTKSSTTDSDIPANKWVHAVWVIDAGTSISFYRNGSQVYNHSTSDTSSSTTNDLHIGSEPQAASTPDYFPGMLTDIRIYNRMLSSAEIQTLYEWGSSDFANPPGASDGGTSYWTLDEDSGSTAYDSWGSNDGSISGATVGVSGVRDTAYSFDGTDDLVDMPGPTSFNSDTTVAFWMKTTQTGLGVPFSTRDGNDQNLALSFRINNNSSNVLEVHRQDDGWSTHVIVESDRAVNTGDWYHVTGTFDRSAGETRVYVNGEHESTATGAGFDVNTPVAPQLGKMIGKSYYYAGDMDDLRFYDRVLEPHEIHELYQYGTFGRDLRKETVNAK